MRYIANLSATGFRSSWGDSLYYVFILFDHFLGLMLLRELLISHA